MRALVQPRTALRIAGAVTAFVVTLTISALNEHAPLDVKAGVAARVIAALVPVIAGAIAALAVWRPWRGFLAVILLTPVVNVAQVSWLVGWVQVIFQTIFLGALAAGLILNASPADLAAGWQRIRSASRGYRIRFAIPAIAAVLFVALAVLSTLRSPDVKSSSDVLIHGILEPVGMGLVLLLLRPTRSRLAAVAVVLGISVGLGGLLNMVQSVPGSTLAALQSDRLLFSRITYFNVGLFGEMVAMAVPLLAAALLARRHLRLSRWAVVGICAALAASLVSLFFTFSKSAYLAAAAGLLALLLLVVQTWRQRGAILLTAALLSSFVVPWPELALSASPGLAQAYRSLVVRVVGQSRFDSWNPSTLSGRGSLVERFYATQAAIEMAINHPQLGVGLDQFQTEYVGEYKPPQAQLDLDSAHSMWAEVSAELGFPALFLLLLVYGAAWVAAWLVYRSPPDPATRLIAAGWLAAMLAWFVVATAFAGDMYRPWRNMASDFVMMSIVMGGAFALYRSVHGRPYVPARAIATRAQPA
jgi:O-antigen ligase